jgi:hypothetical protein
MRSLRLPVLSLFLALLGSAVLPHGLSAQVPTPAYGGLYRMVTGGPSPAAVVDLKFLVPSDFGEIKVLATVLNPAGTYRVYYGVAGRGGLGIYFVNLYPALQPFPFLLTLDPNQPFSETRQFLGAEQCQFDLFTGPAYYDFGCSSVDATGHVSSSQGRLERLVS